MYYIIKMWSNIIYTNTYKSIRHKVFADVETTIRVHGGALFFYPKTLKLRESLTYHRSKYVSTIILIYLLLSVIQVQGRITRDRHRISSIIIYLLRNDGIILCCYYNIIVITLFQSHPHRRLEITRCNNIINIPITFLHIRNVYCLRSVAVPCNGSYTLIQTQWKKEMSNNSVSILYSCDQIFLVIDTLSWVCSPSRMRSA